MKLQETLEKTDFSSSTFEAYCGFVETVAVLTKQFFTEKIMMASEIAEGAADVADRVADVTKAVSVVSSGFQVVALSMRIVAMIGEVKRGREVLPQLRATIVRLLSAVSESMARKLNPEADIHPLLVSNMFQVQQKSLDVMDEIEDYMMRGSIAQFFNANNVKKFEDAVDDLHSRVMLVVLSEEQLKLRNTLKESLSKDEGFLEVPDSYEVPRLSQLFIGRDVELQEMKKILDEYSSAAIANIGGMGKTELMIAFCVLAEKKEWVRGGCYWLPMHGDEARVLSVLADFVNP